MYVGAGGIMLTEDSASASGAVAGTVTTAAADRGVSQCRLVDAAAVVASLRYKMIHCVDERHLTSPSSQQFFMTPEFIASIDRWP